MDKLLETIKKELCEIEKQGLEVGNIEVASKLTEMMKNIAEAECYLQGGKKDNEEGDNMRRYRDYDDYRGGYSDYQGYGTNYRGDYGRQMRDSRGRYMGGNQMGKFDDALDRLADCVEMYEYTRGKYHDGGSEERMTEGLEKLMYSLCMFVESIMNFAETPAEKEIIRKHVNKLQDM